MQISNSLGLYQTVFGQSPNGLKNTNADSITKDVEPQSDHSKVFNKTSKSGVSLEGSTELSYKFKYKAMTPADFEALGLKDPLSGIQFSTSSSGSPQEIQEYKDYWSEKANDKDTKAIIRIGGEIKGQVSQEGFSLSLDSSLDSIMQEALGDIDKLNSLLSEKYGNNFSMETFEEGQGPTVAEAHQLFYGTSLNSYVNNEVQSREQGYQENLQRTEEAQRQKLTYNQSPQVAVFSVGDTVVGSINEKGYLEVNDNILRQADANNLDREALKAFYSYDQISNTDTESVKGMLENVFNDDVKVKHFEKSNRPTLEEVRSTSKAKLLPL